MTVRFIPVAAMVSAVALHIGATAIAQDVPNPAADVVPTPTPTEAVFTPGLSDLMTMLVQPRHVKLYYAGTRKNWELAAFQLREMRSAFRRIGQAIPHYRGSGVDESVEQIMAPALEAVSKAIAAGDFKQFANAFGDVTASCNACHGYMEHPFLVMRVPDPGMKNYSDQEFNP
jgi:hypothetical protein